MSDRAKQCQFLNASDDRCAAHFSVTDLSYLFEYCFGKCHKCPIYHEKQQEKRDLELGKPMVTAAFEGGEAFGSVADWNGTSNASTVEINSAVATSEPVEVAGSPRGFFSQLGFTQLTIGQTGIGGRIAKAFGRTQAAAKPVHHAQHDAADSQLPGLPRL